MEIPELVDEICEAFDAEPEADYGDPSTNRHIRERGIHAKIWDLIQEYSDNLVDDRIAVLEEELDAWRGILYDEYY